MVLVSIKITHMRIPSPLWGRHSLGSEFQTVEEYIHWSGHKQAKELLCFCFFLLLTMNYIDFLHNIGRWPGIVNQSKPLNCLSLEYFITQEQNWNCHRESLDVSAPCSDVATLDKSPFPAFHHYSLVGPLRKSDSDLLLRASLVGPVTTLVKRMCMCVDDLWAHIIRTGK